MVKKHIIDGLNITTANLATTIGVGTKVVSQTFLGLTLTAVSSGKTVSLWISGTISGASEGTYYDVSFPGINITSPLGRIRFNLPNNGILTTRSENTICFYGLRNGTSFSFDLVLGTPYVYTWVSD